MDALDLALWLATAGDEDDATIDHIIDTMVPPGLDPDHLYAA